MIGAKRSSTLMNLEPVITLCLAYYLFKDALQASQIVGVALVIGSVFSSQVYNAKLANMS